MGHCKLNPDLNNCADYLPPDRCRLTETTCGFFVGDRPVEEPEEKKTKWYEQYYEK